LCCKPLPPDELAAWWNTTEHPAAAGISE